LENGTVKSPLNNILVSVRHLTKVYPIGERKIPVLNSITLSINRGEFLILMGPSGSGKTTLLNLIGGIDRVTSGEITYYLNDSNNSKKCDKQGVFDITKLSDAKLTTFRKKNLSYVFQFYSLIPTLTALENVQLMAELVGFKRKELKKQAEYWLKKVGLKERMDNFPSQLSGGEIQRVAIARAIAKEPLLLLCDEPTGQLDKKNSLQVVETLFNVCRSTGTTIVMVTHDGTYKNFGDRVLYLEDGKIIKTEKNTQTES
jgi:putative ABC transport system ATP-binding protein